MTTHQDLIDRVVGNANTFMRMPIICGVYILYNHDQMLYVGKSKNVHRRIQEHQDKPFTHFKIIECSDEDYSALERLLIESYFPSFNKDSETERVYEKKCAIDDLLGRILQIKISLEDIAK